MTVYLIDYKGAGVELPALLSWRVCHGLGSPCDSIELCFVYNKSMAAALAGAVRIKGVYGGQTVFYGVVDEYEISADESGSVASVSGRGLAALLIDNEAEAAEYAVARLEDILSRHVRRYGITEIKADKLSAVKGYTVESGGSEWKALFGFTHYSAGITPRFSRDGALIIGGGGGSALTIDDGTAVTDIRFCEKRYGVISEVLVKNQTLGTSQTVRNEDFIAKGGSCRRVVNVPRGTGYAAMRYTGSYQIEASERERTLCRLTVPALFAAAPGDAVTLDLRNIGISGGFKVSETEVWADGNGAGTAIKLINN